MKGPSSQEYTNTFKTRQATYMKLKHNIQARSCDHCWNGKVISITYSEHVFVDLGILYAMHMHCTVKFGLTGPKIFFYIISQKHDFWNKKKLLNTKWVFWFSLQLLSETFPILQRNERDRKNVYLSSCKVSVILDRF